MKAETRLEQVDSEIKNTRRMLSAILTVFEHVNEKKNKLETKIKNLELEKAHLVQGQMIFDTDAEF